MSLKILSASECDQTAAEFSPFYENDFVRIKSDFENFNRNDCRLDAFWFDKVEIHKFDKLSFVIKLVLTIHHGQASVEREFNVNSTVNEINMKHDFIIAKKKH